MSQPSEYARYGWIISQDYVSEALQSDRNDYGLTGPINIDPAIEKLLQARISLDGDFGQYERIRLPDDGEIDPVLNDTLSKFKMLDDDGNLYYVGWIAGEYDLTEPLDDFGTPNAGAVYLEYLKKDGSWSSDAVEAE